MWCDVIGRIMLALGIILAFIFLLTPQANEIVSLANIIPGILNSPLLLGITICYLIGIVLILLSALFF